MLTPETPFPYAGSYALLVDPDAAAPQAAELVRILARRPSEQGVFAMVSFPLRADASGNKVVAEAELIDATPLTQAEAREFHDLDRELHGRRLRMIYAPRAGELMRRLRALKQRKAA